VLFGRSGVTPATWGPVKRRESGLPLRALRALCGSSLRSDSDFLAGKRNEPRSTQRAQRKGMTHPGQVSRPPVCLRLKSGWSKTSRTIPTLLSLRQDCPRFAIASGICSLLDGTSALALGSFCQKQPRAVVMRSRNFSGRNRGVVRSPVRVGTNCNRNLPRKGDHHDPPEHASRNHCRQSVEPGLGCRPCLLRGGRPFLLIAGLSFRKL